MSIVKDFNGKPIQEGFYLDSFGILVHVRARGSEWEYTDGVLTGYVSLGGYSQLLLGRLAAPQRAAEFIRQKESELAAQVASNGGTVKTAAFLVQREMDERDSPEKT